MSNFHVLAGAENQTVHPKIRKIAISDLFDALRLGYGDFLARPSYVIFLCIMYPIIGVVLASWTAGNNALPMLFPLMSGFALLGPLAAIGLYEISRRREAGLDSSWKRVLDIRHSPAIPSILAVGAFLMVVFIAWLLVARAIYLNTIGEDVPLSIGPFLSQILGTPEGWRLIALGNIVGFVFAALVLGTTVIAFPILLDRDVGAYEAMVTSFRAVMVNPIAMAAWGMIVAALLALGTVFVFAGLIVVVPILGHATWHLYRKVVEPLKR